MNIDTQIPEDFAKLITQAQYEIVVDNAVSAIAKHATVESVINGEVHAHDIGKSNSKMTFNLYSIVRKCSITPQDEWAETIHELLGEPLFNESKHSFFLKDFEYAAPLLKVVVRSKYSFDEASLEKLMYREDIPHTCSFLVLDYDRRFHYMDKALAAEWGQSTERLFEIAFENLKGLKIEVDLLNLEGAKVFVLCHKDLSTSCALKIEDILPDAVGILGSVVHIPTKGQTIIHPISSENPLTYIIRIMSLVSDLHKNEEGPLNMRSYWYYKGKFELFPVGKDKHGKGNISYPNKLKEMVLKYMN